MCVELGKGEGNPDATHVVQAAIRDLGRLGKPGSLGSLSSPRVAYGHQWSRPWLNILMKIGCLFPGPPHPSLVRRGQWEVSRHQSLKGPERTLQACYQEEVMNHDDTEGWLMEAHKSAGEEAVTGIELEKCTNSLTI